MSEGRLIKVYELDGSITEYRTLPDMCFGVTAIGFHIPTLERDYYIHPMQVKRIEVENDPTEL